MDNQNANGGVNPQDNNPTNEPKKSLLDNLKLPHKEQKLENARQQSIVISDREAAAAELQQIQAEQQRQANIEFAQRQAMRAKHASIYVVIGAICVALLASIVIFILAVVPSFKNTGKGPVDFDDDEIVKDKEKIDGYQCMSDECSRFAVLPDGRVMFHDDGYIIYDKSSGDASRTTIPDKGFSDVEFVTWGNRTLAILAVTSGQKNIFSVSDNFYPSDIPYDEIFTKTDDPLYKDMEWVIGDYIITKRADDYRLVEIATGEEKVSGPNGVYASDQGYFISYENSGRKRAYTSTGEEVIYTNETDTLYVRDKVLAVVFSEGEQVDFYSGAQRGGEMSFEQEVLHLRDMTLKQYVQTNKAFVKIPDSRL